MTKLLPKNDDENMPISEKLEQMSEKTEKKSTQDHLFIQATYNLNFRNIIISGE